MASEPIGQGVVFGDQTELNKISYSESTNTVEVQGAARNLNAKVQGEQTWSGGSVSDSRFELQGPGSAANALALENGENRLTMNTKTSFNVYEGSDGEDTIRFRKKSKKDVVNLGEDNSGDLVDVKSLKKTKKLTITDFGSEDSLKVGKKTYDYDQLQDKSFKNISIRFD
jgi:hypothetical protein